MPMQLNDSLTLIAMQLQLDPAELIRYANEDTIGGFHWKGDEQKWPMGSLYAVEGQTLYALVRILKPDHVVEIGSLRGCSTAHLATALSVNGSGRLTAVDIATDARDQFPKHLESVLTGVTGDGLEWLAGQEDESVDLLFEDSSHGPDMCASIAELCKTKLTPGGVLVMHDAGHDIAYVGGGVQVPSPVGSEVRSGLDRALGTSYRVYLAEPSDCGVAVWQRPNETVSAIRSAYNDLTQQAKTIGLKPITEEADYSPVIDAPPQEHWFKGDDKFGYLPTTDLVSDGNYPDELAKETPTPTQTKFALGVEVKVIDPASSYFGQVGNIYENYRSGNEPQSYGVHFSDDVEFWVRETDLELVVTVATPPLAKVETDAMPYNTPTPPKPKRKPARKPKAKA